MRTAGGTGRFSGGGATLEELGKEVLLMKEDIVSLQKLLGLVKG